MILRHVLIYTLLVCSCIFAKETFQIGRDPTWYPLNFQEKQGYVNAFTEALVNHISHAEGVDFQIIPTDYLSLITGMEDKDYQAAFTSIEPDVEMNQQFDFSQPFLLIGPVLVVRKDSPITKLSELEGKIVGISSYNRSVWIAQKIPHVIIRNYQHMPQALVDLTSGKLEAILFDNISAKSFINNGFGKVLKIASPPLTHEGLRVMTLKGKHKKLLKSFDKGLAKMHKTSQYKRLLKTYRLN